MSFLSKLRTHVVLDTESPSRTLLIARTPAAVPDIEVDLRRSFLSPQPYASVLSSAAAEAATPMTIQSLSGAAPVPEIEVGIPRDKPAPPEQNSGQQS